MTYGRPGVYINETLLPAPIPGAGSANAAGAAVGAFVKGPSTLTLVTSWYDFVQKFGGYDAKFPATFGIGQFFTNGGSELYVRRVLGADAAQAVVSLPSTTSGQNLGTVKAKDFGADGNNLRVQITGTNRSGYYNLIVYKEVVTQYSGTNDANGTNDVIVETFNNVVFNDADSADYAQTVVNAVSTTVYLTLTSTGIPATQAISSILPLTGGDDGATPDYEDYSAVFATDGSSELDTVNRPLVVFAPEAYAKFVVDGDASAAAHLGSLHDQMIAWAESGSGFAVIDTAPGLTVSGAIDYIDARTEASHVAGYYPHYYISDPVARSRQALRKVGPASAVAGLYLATDKAAGPFKTPAGTGTSIRGAVSLERAFTPKDLDSLNTGTYTSGGTTYYKTPINAVRNLPGAGIVVMGGRTLKQDGTANRYVNTRRSLIYIRKSLENITEFAVFRNNDAKLWSQLNTAVSVFLNEYRNQGGLRGNTPGQAYYIKCNESNNTAATIAEGIVNIEVGVALEYPAEFVVINLSQITGN